MLDMLYEEFIDDDIVMSVVDSDIDDIIDAEEDLLSDNISDSDAIDIVMGEDDLLSDD
jgi:hypothetical protein